MKNLHRLDPSAPVHLVCYATGGASIASDDGTVWCATTRYEGWHPASEALQHARYFLRVSDALQFARGMGWIRE